jgi:Nif11 domain
MAIEEVTRFFAAVKSDPKLKQAVAQVTAHTWPDAANEIARVAAANGYRFTGADYEEAVRKTLDEKWWRYRKLDSEQEKLLGSTAADVGAPSNNGCPTRLYTPCGC